MLSAPRPAKVGKWTEPALRVLRERYLNRKNNEVIETPEEMCWRVAQCLAQAEERWGKSQGAVQEIARAFYDLMVESYFLPNSPTLMNAGRGNQLQYSACYVLPVGDSMEEIFDAVKAAAIIHKCLVGDTLVMTDKGLTRLGEVSSGTSVMTDEGPFGVSALHDNGDQPVFEVRTHRGLKVVGTAEHRLLAVGDDGGYQWRRIGELREGDWLVVKPGFWTGGETKLPEFTFTQRPGGNETSFKAFEYQLPQELTPELAELIGLYIGDGSNHRDGIRFTVGTDSPELIEKIQQLSFQLFGKSPTISVSHNAVEVSILSTQIRQWFDFLGLTKASSREAHVPRIVLQSHEKVASAFVRGLFSADGCVRKNGHITLTTASERLAEELQVMMLALGIPTQLRRDVSETGYRSYQLSVCTKAGFRTFREKIGFLDRRKQKRLTVVDDTQIFVKGETIPNQRRRLRTWYDALPRHVRPHAKVLFDDLLNRVKDPRELSRQRLTAAMGVTSVLPRFFKKLAAEDFFFVRVTAIGYVGIRRVYDLTVPLKHAYVANGFAAHNSGGGTGFAFSRLRPKDDLVASTGGKASGPVSFLRVFNGATEAVKQGGTRRGANMGILRVDHPDILEFIDSKLDGGITNFNISVAATDRFMEALARGEEYDLVNPHTGAVVGRVRAQEVIDRIVKAAWQTGDPGMVFIDRINASPANPTPEVGMVEATNPCGEQPLLPNEACFAPETRITTDRGLETVADLYHRQEAGETILVATNLNGRGKHIVFRPAVVVKTGIKSTVRVTLTNGQQIRVTADHKILTEGGWKEAGALAREDRVCIQTAMAGPLHITSSDGDLQRMLGWFTGDGWFTESVGLTFGPEDELAFQRLVPVWRQFTGSLAKAQTQATMVRCLGTERTSAIAAFQAYGFTPARGPGKRVPKYVFAAPKEEQLRYLQGLFCADGSKTHRKPQVTLASASLELLRDVQLLLVNLGTRSNIKYYPHRPTGRAWGQLKVNGESYHRFLDLVGFPLTPRKQERCEQFPWQRVKKDQLAVPVASVVPAGEVEVYDISEPVTHSLIAEGMIVHNCNLGSINVSKFAKLAPNGEWTIDWEELERVVRLSVRFLDDVIEMNPYPLPEIDETVKANRRIGLGVMGWADLLFAMGIPYDSQQALDLADQLMAFIEEKGHDQSARLAEERGPFPNWSRSIYKNDRPLRNSTITTVAPTGTISMIAGCSSGIEPIFALAFEHRVKQPDGERVLTFVNETFERIAREQGFYSEALMQEVVRHGTLHGLPGVDARVFKTSHEIPYEWHVRHQAAYQKHTDNGVSKCVAGDTLIFTGEGILRIQDLYGGEAADSFRPIQLKVGDWAGAVEANLFYFGGKRATIALETDLGSSLHATPNHRVRVMANGEVVWRRMDEIKVGDFLVVPFGLDIYGHRHDFKVVYGSYYRPAERANANRLQWPRKITTDLARLLGYLIADGGFNRNQVMFTQQDEGVFEDYRSIIQRRFGVEPRVSLDLRRENLKQAVVNSRDLIAFFSDYLGTGDRADTKHTPRCILASGPEVMKEFVRGLTLDGYVSQRRRLVVLGTVSRRLAEEAQAVLLNLGIVARLETKGISYEYRHDENRKDVCYEVVVLPRFRRAFLERIGFAEERKNAVAREQLQRRRQPATHSVVPGVRPLAVSLARTKRVEASSEKLRDYLHSFITADAEVTEETIMWLLDITRELKETSEWKALASVVNQKVVYTRVTELRSDKEEVFDLQIPSTHSFITNGLISHNTINLPNTATEEDIAKAYLLAWELGCLGITIFRDGCKGDQVLNVGVKKEEAPPASGRAQVMIKPRPHSLAGHTYRMETPVGTAFITVNDTADGDPFEVFLSVGKAGSDTMAVAEALGRLISLILRLPSPLSPHRRLEAVIGQLSRIGGGQPMGFGASKVLSLPDALGRLLAEHIGATTPEGGESTGTGPRRIGDLCKECGQATFIYEEGCKKCLSCGYNEC